MKTRAITGFFFVAIMLASLVNGPYIFTAFLGLLSFLCLNEFYTLVKSPDISPNRVAGLIGGLCIFAGNNLHYILNIDPKFLLISIPVLLSIFIAELYKKSEHPFNNIAYTCLGFIFSVSPFCFLFALAFITGKFAYHFPLGFLLLLWANDTGAYVVGLKFGKTKLFERHSPKKTWEGFFGGMLFTMAISLLVCHYFPDINWRQWMTIAVLISSFGTMGDLIESMLKRSFNAKDSGTLLPGHGGLLDRFDGLLLAAPAVFVYLYLISN
ncbi:phosphatidate cytidylyltransferase [Mucilaginibacter paludis]|uniref:Phosphatidate cytidylyltransferase n=1 Tax=Mucilaginibacter paludis DSM 18603 TaxID=714943 RepID=H1YIS4_9SPHI|nr:phosphatidate cytidylyltransferase [Mucilaginibacter paludis]EHQ27619.1 phosphatidate cytidylyltransferase [Mucilaginibacter paludis DSM 18603]